MLARIVLLASAAVWLPYGLYCFLVPTALAGMAGVEAASTTGTIELRAMYGGLQVGIGLLTLLGALWGGLRRPALVALLFLCGGLASARLLGSFAAGELSAYTAFGLGFELLSAGLAARLLRRGAVPA